MASRSPSQQAASSLSGRSPFRPSALPTSGTSLRFNDRSTSDFVFVAEHQDIYVHRSIIMAQSAFLRRFLTEDPTCSRINANNAKHAAMKATLGALYIIPLDLSSYAPDLRASIVLQALKLGGGGADRSSSSHVSATPPPRSPGGEGGGGSSPAAATTHDLVPSNFDVILSIWEIALHFQLTHIGHHVMSQLLLPLIDRRNVVRCLKGALKHQASSPDAQHLIEWCVDNGLLPPELETAQSIAEWETLSAKYPWLREAGGPQVGGSFVEGGHALSERGGSMPLVHHAEEANNHAVMVPLSSQRASRSVSIERPAPSSLAFHSIRTESPAASNASAVPPLRHGMDTSKGSSVSPRGGFDETAAVSSGTDRVVAAVDRLAHDVHALRHEMSATPRSRSVSEQQQDVAQEPYVSPQRQDMRYLQEKAQRHKDEKMLVERQQEADEELIAEIAKEKELLRVEEAEFERQAAQWASEIAHLSGLHDGLESEDLDIVETKERLEELEKQRADVKGQLSELARLRADVDAALEENDVYLKSTAAYLPAAANAYAELSTKISEWNRWLAKTTAEEGGGASPSSRMGAVLRQKLSQCAATLRSEKDTALKTLESEAKIEDALRRHIDVERSNAMQLQGMLDAHAASLSSDASR